MPFDAMGPAGFALLALIAHPGDTHLHCALNEGARLNLLLIQTQLARALLVDGWCLSFSSEKRMLILYL